MLQKVSFALYLDLDRTGNRPMFMAAMAFLESAFSVN